MNQDELLQKSLEAIEHGTPLAEVLAALPAGEQELAALLSLAVQTHETVQSTHINPLKAQSQQQRVTAAARRMLPPARVTKTARPRSFWVLLSAGAAVFAVFALISVAALAFLLSTAASARAATLMDVSGIVETCPDPGRRGLEPGDRWRKAARRYAPAHPRRFECHPGFL